MIEKNNGIIKLIAFIKTEVYLTKADVSLLKIIDEYNVSSIYINIFIDIKIYYRTK